MIENPTFARGSNVKRLGSLLIQTAFALGFMVNITLAEQRLIFGQSDQPSSEWFNDSHQVTPSFLQQNGLLGLKESLEAIQNSNTLAGLNYIVFINDYNHSIQDGFGDAIQVIDGQEMIVPQRYNTQAHGVVLLVGESYGQHYISGNSIEQWRNFVVQTGMGNEPTAEIAVDPESSDAAASGAPMVTSNIPGGKGVFQYRRVTLLGTPEEMAENFRNAQLTWIAWSAMMSSDVINRYNEAIREVVPGLQSYTWLLNHPYRYRYPNGRRIGPNEQVDLVIERANDTNSNGIILDIEGSFRSRATAAHEMYVYAREQANQHNLAVGITPMGLARIPGYINEEDMRNADFIMPQLYDRDDRLSPSQHRQRSELWNSVSETVIPLSAAHHCVTVDSRQSCRSKNVAEMQELLDNTTTENGAIGWWSYWWIDNGNRWDVVRDYSLSR